MKDTRLLWIAMAFTITLSGGSALGHLQQNRKIAALSSQLQRLSSHEGSADAMRAKQAAQAKQVRAATLAKQQTKYLTTAAIMDWVTVHGIEEPLASQITNVLAKTGARVRLLAQQAESGEISPDVQAGKTTRELRDRDATILSLLEPKHATAYRRDIEALAAKAGSSSD